MKSSSIRGWEVIARAYSVFRAYRASPEIYSNNAMSDEGVKATEHFDNDSFDESLRV